MLLDNYICTNKNNFYAVLTSSFLCLAASHGDREMNGTEGSVLYTVEHDKTNHVLELCVNCKSVRLIYK